MLLVVVVVDDDILFVYREFGPPGSNWYFSLLRVSVSYSAPRVLHRRAAYWIC